jgi:hypothetical protein
MAFIRRLSVKCLGGAGVGCANAGGKELTAAYYKIWQKGAPVGKGATQSVHVGVAGIAKGNKPGPPSTVANELIASRLAGVLLLPIPPGFLIELEGEPHFVSLNFNLAGQELPPADGQAVIAHDQHIAVGVVLFDAWIVNHDRHEQNLSHDQIGKKIQIFDHSHALMGTGRQHLVNSENVPAIGNHFVARELKSLAGMHEWHKRMMSVPEYYIRSVVMDAASPELGLSSDDAKFCADFLVQRRVKLIEIFKANPLSLPKVAPDEWNSLP